MTTQVNNINLARLDEKMSELLEYVAFLTLFLDSCPARP